MPSGILYQADPLAILASPKFQRTLQVHFLLLALVLFVAWLARGAEFPSLKGRRSTRPAEKTEVCAEVAALYVYPIKSCAGTELKEAVIGKKGWELDRRWMVWRIGKGKLSLREEPKLTLIVPTIDKDANQLRLALSPKAAIQQETIAVPLYPTEQQLSSWEKIEVEMYGDGAHGRVVQAVGRTGMSVSEWLSKFLGYEAVLLQFDPKGEQRAAFPLLRPPADLERWKSEKRKQLEAPQGIEFQDEYPFLIATQESLNAVRAQLVAAATGASSSPPTDGAGGQVIRNLDGIKWSVEGGKLSMQRFRPNIVLRARQGSTYKPFSEDDWDSLWFAPSASLSQDGDVQEVKATATASLSLVARCQRCLLTTVDPETAERDVTVPLALLRRSRLKHKHAKRPGPCFGMYAIPLLVGNEPSEKSSFGSISVGDAVAVRWRPPGEDVETR